MTELRFIGVEEGHLIVSGDDGRQHRVRIDDALREAVRPRPAERRESPKVPPREIQQLIRAGRSVDEVVELTGAEAEDVARFEGPIRAERDYIVDQARAVPVRVRAELDPLSEGATFGSALDERLETLGAKGVRWDAWKDPEEGWQVQLEFAVDELERDARWAYDPKTRSLSPRNPAATTLSQQGEMSSLHAPRLRAVDAPGSDAAPVERSTAREARRQHPTAGVPAAREPEASPDHVHETADLLEALRRRRGEREPVRLDDEDLEAEFDAEFPAPAVPQPHRPPISLAQRMARGGDEAEDDGGALPDADAPVPNRTAGMTGGIDRIRRGSSKRKPQAPRFVDIPLEGFDDVEVRPDPADEPSDRRQRAAAEREAAARAASGPSGLAAEDAEDEAARPAAEPAAPEPAAQAESAPHDEPATQDEAPAEDAPAPRATPAQTTGSLGRRRSRASMPSWDEIVFGTKRDD